MTHCEGGVTLDKFDALMALTDWVEKGKAPDGSSRPSIRPTGSPRLLEPDPQPPALPLSDLARYKGGDPESAACFESRSRELNQGSFKCHRLPHAPVRPVRTRGKESGAREILDQLNSLRISCEFWLAIDSDWMPTVPGCSA